MIPEAEQESHGMMTQLTEQEDEGASTSQRPRAESSVASTLATQTIQEQQ